VFGFSNNAESAINGPSVHINATSVTNSFVASEYCSTCGNAAVGRQPNWAAIAPIFAPLR